MESHNPGFTRIGSNIFNALLICGTRAVIHAIDVPQPALTDLAFTAALPLLLMLTAHTP